MGQAFARCQPCISVKLRRPGCSAQAAVPHDTHACVQLEVTVRASDVEGLMQTPAAQSSEGVFVAYMHGRPAASLKRLEGAQASDVQRI